MTYTEWLTRIKKYRIMEYMKFSYVERAKIRKEYVDWYKMRYQKEPVHISI